MTDDLSANDLSTGEPVLGNPLLTHMGRFAQLWFEDALKEARNGSDANARRREILFAVCFAESYLIEWAHDEVFRDYSAFTAYLDTPPRKSNGKPGTAPARLRVEDKWKRIPDDLHITHAAQVPNAFVRSESDWSDWDKLVKYRNGLVHGRSSRPEKTGQPSEKVPSPTLAELKQMAAGWPTEIVVKLVRRLHQAAQTTPPSWLKDP